MKVIFLDIDGVLNNEVFVNSFWAICRQVDLKRDDAKALRKIVMADKYGTHFCPTACNMLEYLIKETNAKIVISSSWRSSGLQYMQDMWRERCLAGEVIDITPDAARFNENGLWTTKERGYEIQEWLDKNPVEQYVIIDDDKDMLPHQMQNFIQTDYVYGLSLDNVERAIKILNQ